MRRALTNLAALLTILLLAGESAGAQNAKQIYRILSKNPLLFEQYRPPTEVMVLDGDGQLENKLQRLMAHSVVQHQVVDKNIRTRVQQFAPLEIVVPTMSTREYFDEVDPSDGLTSPGEMVLETTLSDLNPIKQSTLELMMQTDPKVNTSGLRLLYVQEPSPVEATLEVYRDGTASFWNRSSDVRITHFPLDEKRIAALIALLPEKGTPFTVKSFSVAASAPKHSVMHFGEAFRYYGLVDERFSDACDSLITEMLQKR